MWLFFLFLLLCLFSFVLYVIYIFFDDEWKMRKSAPYIWSYISHKKLLQQYRHKIHWTYILDMWCGDGGILRFFIKNMASHHGDWYDIRRFPIKLGKILNRLFWYKEITLYQQDFLDADMWKYDTVYLFLWPSILEDIEKRIHSRIRPWTVIITNTFHFKTRVPFDVIQNSKGKVVFQLYKKSIDDRA